MNAPALEAFQRSFARALLATEPRAAGLAGITAQPAFAVYRNTVMKGCIDALEANFPSVRRLVGDEWFRAAAAVYVQRKTPSTPMLLDYGADFSTFLRGFAPAAELPYLADVAALDRYWAEAHVSADEEPVSAARVAALAPAALAHARLVPHRSARWLFFADRPSAEIWRRSRAGERTLGDIVWAGGGVLIARPKMTVEATDLDAAGCAFLDACAAGDTVADAAAAGLARDIAVDLASLMARFLEAGAFGKLIEGEPA